MFMTKSPLFVAGEAGYTTFRIPAVSVTARGVLLAFCSARPGTGGDWDQNDIVLRRSSDQGYTWEPMRVFAADPQKCVIDNPCPIADRSGAVHMLYARQDARMLYRRSDDDGQTWSDPVDIASCVEGLRSLQSGQPPSSRNRKPRGIPRARESDAQTQP
jgi:sialidase-1